MLNFPVVKSWSLSGLGAEESLSVNQVFGLMRPMITGIPDDSIKGLISELLQKYSVTKSSQPAAPSAEGDIRGLVIKHIGMFSAMTHQGELKAAFENLDKQGYTIVERSSATPTSTAPATVDRVVSNATTSGPGKEPAAIDTFNAAIDIVKEMAPALIAAKQQEAAQKLLAKQKAGQQIYRKKKWMPWVVGGIGVLAVLGIVYVVVKR